MQKARRELITPLSKGSQPLRRGTHRRIRQQDTLGQKRPDYKTEKALPSKFNIVREPSENPMESMS